MFGNLKGSSARQIQEKASRRLIVKTKKFMNLFRLPNTETRPVFIIGNGRSGTTMLINLFERDFRVDGYNENDPRIADNYLLDFDKLAIAIELSKLPVMVAKPILNTFDVMRLLNDYDNSRVVWMVRSYKDMASSAKKLFGDRLPRYMHDLVVDGSGDNFLSKGMPQNTLKRLRELDCSGFSNLDWIALVWWSVNVTAVDNNLHNDPRVLLVRYDLIVPAPEKYLQKISYFMGLEYLPRLGAYINARSVGKGSDVALSPVVEKICSELYEELKAKF